MRIITFITIIALLTANQLFTFSQSTILENEQNKDTTLKITEHPSVDIYGNSWDTMYVRLSRHEKVNLQDSIILNLLNEENTAFVMPVPGKVLSEFGWRHGRIHAGIDIQLNKGDSVHSAFDGVVRMSRYFSGYGNIVVVRHYNGLETCYAHMSKLISKVNDVVKAGDVVGLGGRTGHATCNHLHFEVRYKQEPINPRLIVDFENQKITTEKLVVSNETFFHKNKNTKNKQSSKNKIFNEPVKGYYTIRQGDTLYSLAKKYNTTVASLCDKNNISKNSTLRIGQKLKL